MRFALIAIVMMETGVLAQTKVKKRKAVEDTSAAMAAAPKASLSISADAPKSLTSSSALRPPPTADKPAPGPDRTRPPTPKPNDKPTPKPNDDKPTPRPTPKPDHGGDHDHHHKRCRNNGKYFCRSRKERKMYQFDAHDWGKHSSKTLRSIHDYLNANNRNYFSTNGKTANEKASIKRQEDRFNTAIANYLRTTVAKNAKRKPQDFDCEPDCVVKFPYPEVRPYPEPWRPYPWWPHWKPTPVELPQCSNATMANETWGLDRIEQPDLNLTEVGGQYDYTYNRPCVCCGLERTVAFVLDTGVQPHCEFGSRLLTAEGRSFEPDTGNVAVIPPYHEVGDTHGHGTHVAGTIAGCTVGVNTCTTIVGIRVFPKNSGSTWRSWIIGGIDYVTGKALDPDDSLVNYHKTINLSVGGGKSTAYETAINAAYDAGVTVVVAAGNSYGADSCDYSPSHVPLAITVGSTDIYDNISSFSNVGPCVDIFAPGSAVWSAHENEDETEINMDESCEYTYMSGTSMAAPHVAGVATLGHAYGLADTPAQTWSWIKCTAFKNKIQDSPYPADTVNLLLRVLLQTCRTLHHLHPHKYQTLGPGFPH